MKKRKEVNLALIKAFWVKNKDYYINLHKKTNNKKIINKKF